LVNRESNGSLSPSLVDSNVAFIIGGSAVASDCHTSAHGGISWLGELSQEVSRCVLVLSNGVRKQVLVLGDCSEFAWNVQRTSRVLNLASRTVLIEVLSLIVCLNSGGASLNLLFNVWTPQLQLDTGNLLLDIPLVALCLGRDFTVHRRRGLSTNNDWVSVMAPVSGTARYSPVLEIWESVLHSIVG